MKFLVTILMMVFLVTLFTPTNAIKCEDWLSASLCMKIKLVAKQLEVTVQGLNDCFKALATSKKSFKTKSNSGKYIKNPEK